MSSKVFTNVMEKIVDSMGGIMKFVDSMGGILPMTKIRNGQI